MENNLIEAVGFLLVVAFFWFVWPPLVLLVGGLVLLLVANVRAGRERDPNRPRLIERLVAASAAAAAAYRGAVR